MAILSLGLPELENNRLTSLSSFKENAFGGFSYRQYLDLKLMASHIQFINKNLISIEGLPIPKYKK